MGEGLQLYCTVLLWRNAALQIRLFGFLSEYGNQEMCKQDLIPTKYIPDATRYIWVWLSRGFKVKVSGKPLKVVQQLFIFGCGEMTPLSVAGGLQSCQTGCATPKTKHENDQIPSLIKFLLTSSSKFHLSCVQYDSALTHPTQLEVYRQDDLAHCWRETQICVLLLPCT